MGLMWGNGRFVTLCPMKKQYHLLMTLFALVGLVHMALAMPSRQGAIVVDSLSDSTGVRPCTLRAAISAANSNTAVQGCSAGSFGHDTITFAVDGTFSLTQSGNDNDNSAGDLDILEPLTIVGNGSDLTVVDGNALDSVFHIQLLVPVTLTQMTIQNGLTAGFGGGVNSEGDLVLATVVVQDNVAHDGGGVRNGGTAVIRHSTIRNNEAHNGGGIENFQGMLTIDSSTIHGNQATGHGGGFANLFPSAMTTIVNSTITDNFAIGLGSGLYNRGQLVATNSTVFDNNLGDAGVGFYSDSEVGVTAVFRNMIIAQNLGADCLGAAASLQGANLSSDDSCTGFSLPDTDPVLGNFQDNGGLTWTFLPQANSPAVDAGDTAICAEIGDVDQRGYGRLDIDGNNNPNDGNSCDLGAVELDGLPNIHLYLPFITN